MSGFYTHSTLLFRFLYTFYSLMHDIRPQFGNFTLIFPSAQKKYCLMASGGCNFFTIVIR